MAKNSFDTVRELIYWSYANLAMAHSAVGRRQAEYSQLNYMIRARLFKGLKAGSMNLRTIFDDEKIKIYTGMICNYCGSSINLSLDHIFPKFSGGSDNAENLIIACKNCNSSKGKKDLMEWMIASNTFLPLMVIRRYLKLVYNFCLEFELLDVTIDEMHNKGLPFNITLLPTTFPSPKYLVLNANELLL